MPGRFAIQRRTIVRGNPTRLEVTTILMGVSKQDGAAQIRRLAADSNPLTEYRLVPVGQVGDDQNALENRGQ